MSFTNYKLGFYEIKSQGTGETAETLITHTQNESVNIKLHGYVSNLNELLALVEKDIEQSKERDMEFLAGRLDILEDVKTHCEEYVHNQPSLADKVNNFITKRKEIAEETAKYTEELDELVESVYEDKVLPFFRELYPTLDVLAQELNEKNVTISIDWGALASNPDHSVLFYANSNRLHGLTSNSTIAYINFTSNRYIVLDKDDTREDMSYECKKTLVQNFPLIKERVENSISAFLDRYLADEERRLNDTKENVGNIKNGKKAKVEVYDIELEDGVPY